MKAPEVVWIQGVPPSPFRRPLWPGCNYSQKNSYTSIQFMRYWEYQMDYSLRTFLIYRCCNDVNILWQPFYLRRQVQFFLEEQFPFMSNEDIQFQEQKMTEGSYIDVDIGVKLHYIKICYNMLLLCFLYYQNHTIGV